MNKLLKWVFYIFFFFISTLFIVFILGGIVNLFAISNRSIIYKIFVNAPILIGFGMTKLFAPDLYRNITKQ